MLQRLSNGLARQLTCRCPSCVHAHHAVRTMGGQSIGTKPRYLTSSTYWMSGIFASAALLDADRKIRRNDQWDAAIADLKQELAMDNMEEKVQKDDEKVGLSVPLNLQQGDEKVGLSVPLNLQQDDEKVGLSVPLNLQQDDEKVGLSVSLNLQQDDEKVGLSVPLKLQQSELSIDHGISDRESHIHEDDTPGPRLRYRRVEGPEKRKKKRVALFQEPWIMTHDVHTVDPTIGLLDQAKEQEIWHVNTGEDLTQHVLAPNSVYLTEEFRMHRRSPWSAKKAEIVNVSTNLLQLNIILRLKEAEKIIDIASMPQSVQQMLSISHPLLWREESSLKEELHMLWKASPDLHLHNSRRRDSKIPLVVFHAQDGTDYTKPTHLNNQLYLNFKQHTNDTTSLFRTLANIYDILDGSMLPPNVHTYNILIAGLSDCRLPTLTHHTINTLRRCQLRPNETTVAIVLEHYTKYDDWKHFEKWLKILNGKDGGLALAQADKAISGPWAPRLVRNEEQMHKIVQLQPPSPKVFSALIAGTIRFWGMDHALQRCESMGKEGWGVSMNTLGPMIRDCVRRGDHDLALGLWSIIQKLEAKMSTGLQPQSIPQHVCEAVFQLAEAIQASDLRDHMLSRMKRKTSQTASFLDYQPSSAPSFDAFQKRQKELDATILANRMAKLHAERAADDITLQDVVQTSGIEDPHLQEKASSANSEILEKASVPLPTILDAQQADAASRFETEETRQGATNTLKDEEAQQQTAHVSTTTATTTTTTTTHDQKQDDKPVSRSKLLRWQTSSLDAWPTHELYLSGNKLPYTQHHAIRSM